MSEYHDLLTQNRTLTEAVKRGIDHLAAINAVATSVSQSLDLDETLNSALQTVLSITGADAGGISLIEAGSGDVILRAQQGWLHDFVHPIPMRVPAGEGMSGRVIQTDSLIVEHDLNGSQAIAVPRFYDEAFRSMVMAPMHARGKIIGILSIMGYQPHQFDESVSSVLSVIADTVGVALDNARLYEAALENQLRLSAILQSTADGIIATDCTGHIQLINQTAAAMLDVSAEQMVGKHLRSVPLPAPIRESLLYVLASRGASNQTFVASLDNGRILSVLASEITVNSQVDQRVDTEGWVLVLQDVTHLREAEMARTRFIQAAAHDMRNPLGIVTNSLDMLVQRLAPLDETTSEIIEIAAGSVDRLQNLIEDLFNLENIESGSNFNLIEVEIGEFIYEVSAGIKPALDTRQIDFRVDLQPGIPPVRLDRQWVSRAIANYLDNAVKYTPPRSRVTLRAFTNGEMLHIEVADNGPGVPLEAQARVFERFYRAEGTGSVPGTGLGLAIVQSVAEAHGGSVYLKSRPPHGSVFGMTLRTTLELTV